MQHISLQQKKTHILDIHRRLVSSRTLSPSTDINHTFSELVSIVKNTSARDAETLLKDISIAEVTQDLRAYSSQGESALEIYWAKKILASASPEDTLKAFPYYQNYELLTEYEVKELQACVHHDMHRILFVGSGALPLSSILMRSHMNVSIDNLDIDKETCELSQTLISRLGLSDHINTIHGDVLAMYDFSSYDCVCIASLVGIHEGEKKNIIDHILTHVQPHTHIMLRDVEHLGALLYPPITPAHTAHMEIMSKAKKPQNVINNIIIAKKK
jgi:nicotianamine synthase